MTNNIGLYAKAIGGSLAAAATAAITALSDGHISTSEWITIAISFCISLGGVWAVPNMPTGIAKYAKMITGAVTAGLGALATAYVAGNSISQVDLINIGIAVLGSLGIVYVTPNAAQSDVFAGFMAGPAQPAPDVTTPQPDAGTVQEDASGNADQKTRAL